MDSLPSLSSRETLAKKLAEGLARGNTHRLEDVFAAVECGKMQLWEGDASALVTVINDFPLVRVCEVFLAAGDLKEIWKIHDERIVPWARGMGCTRMVGQGRPGWLKSAAENGYGNKWILVSKEI